MKPRTCTHCEEDFAAGHLGQWSGNLWFCCRECRDNAAKRDFEQRHKTPPQDDEPGSATSKDWDRAFGLDTQARIDDQNACIQRMGEANAKAMRAVLAAQPLQPAPENSEV